ncbi:MAG TPA: hypothetical protein VL309_01685 [Vicinamibacterales bacterium]|nr:hypothetical protein [Vicinamibacterales bacterium]
MKTFRTVRSQRIVRTLVVAFLASVPLVAIKPDVLRSVGAVPPHIAGRFRDAIGFQQSAFGQYYVFDRRGHTVYGIDEAQESVWQIVEIGAEPGHIIDPTAFSVAPDGTFVVADAPAGVERIQIFSPVGVRTGGFTLRGRARPRIVSDSMVLSGIGSLQYTGESILMSQPEIGGLVSEYALNGGVTRSFGNLRPTGHDEDRDLQLALNSGIPLRDPLGGFYFVFQAGPPAFRKYDAAGRLLFERHIQGREIDDVVAKQPTVWPRRQTEFGEVPLVSPIVRAAAVDGSGNLWIALSVPVAYVFDPDGDKIRAVQLRGAGLLTPSGLFFGRHGRLLVAPGLYEFAP